METDKGTPKGHIIFYAIVFMSILVAFWSGYRLGKSVEENQHTVVHFL